MVVDDEKDVEFLFRQTFRKEIREGLLQITFCLSGEEALSHFTGSTLNPFVLVLSDINMPGMNGLDLLKKVKAAFPTLKVCMLTAYNDEQNYKAAMENGADDYFTKPVDFVKLKKDVLSL
jgi:two-component system response regulator (stage 0 sporulation protein F)